MNRWMCLVISETGCYTKFFDELYVARQYQMDAVCGMGLRCQIYEWVKDCYKFREE